MMIADDVKTRDEAKQRLAEAKASPVPSTGGGLRDHTAGGWREQGIAELEAFIAGWDALVTVPNPQIPGQDPLRASDIETLRQYFDGPPKSGGKMLEATLEARQAFHRLFDIWPKAGYSSRILLTVRVQSNLDGEWMEVEVSDHDREHNGEALKQGVAQAIDTGEQVINPWPEGPVVRNGRAD